MTTLLNRWYRVTPKTTAAAALSLLIVVGLVLRWYRLDYQSLRLDEAASAYFASLSYHDIFYLPSVAESSPPLYYLLLRGWTSLFGNSEIGLRSLSVLGGALYIPLIYLLGSELLTRRAGLLAALVATVNPFLVWHSQEARPYAWVALFTLASAYLFLKACRQDRLIWWAGFSVATAVGLYVHFYAALLLPFQLLFLLVWWRRRRSLVSFLAAITIPVLIYLPWLASMMQAEVAGNWRPFYNFPPLLLASFHAFIAGEILPQQEIGWWLAGFSGICLVGVLPLRAKTGEPIEAGQAFGFLGLYLFTPMVLSFLLSLYSPIFVPYYMIVAAAPFYLFLANGLDKLWRISIVLTVIGCALVFWVSGWTLNVAYNTSIKEDYRSAAQFLQQRTEALDAVVFLAGYAKLGFNYYGIEGMTPLGFVSNVAEVEEALLPVADSHSRLWLVLSHEQLSDPQGLVIRWLSKRYPKVTEQYPVGVQIHGYLTRYRLSSLPESATALEASFGDKIRLVGYEVANPNLPARDSKYHPPSNWLHVTLYWQAAKPVSEDYAVMVRMIDHQGQVWGNKLNRPGETTNVYPTSCWHRGEVVRAEYDVNLNPITPAGEYKIEVGLLSGGNPLAVVIDGRAVSDRLIFGSIEILPSDRFGNH